MIPQCSYLSCVVLKMYNYFDIIEVSVWDLLKELDLLNQQNYIWTSTSCLKKKTKQQWLINLKSHTFVLSLVSRGHALPVSAFRKQHNTDLSVRLCLDFCQEREKVSRFSVNTRDWAWITMRTWGKNIRWDRSPRRGPQNSRVWCSLFHWHSCKKNDSNQKLFFCIN